MRSFDKLLSTLRELVLARAPNDKLPSVRSLMKRHGASLYSVNIALKRLAEEELLDIRHGSGIYVRARSGSRYIEFHRPMYPSSSMDIKELSLSRAVTARGWQLLVRHYGAGSGDEGRAMNPVASAHVVIPSLLDAFPVFREQVLQQSVPVMLAFDSNLEQLPLDHVMGNDHQYLSFLIKHFKLLGHRRIALVQNEPPGSRGTGRNYRNELFTDIMGLLDLPAQIIDCGTLSGENSMLKAYEGLCRHLDARSGRPDFTALIAGSAAGVPGILRALHERGISVPGDCSLGSAGMEVENSIRIPSVTEVGVADEKWGEGVVNILERRFAAVDAPPMTVKLEPTLYVRESSGPAPVCEEAEGMASSPGATVVSAVTASPSSREDFAP